MDLQILKIFCVVASEGSLSKAAERLNYAQSNLSTKIKQLEKELQVELFYRHNHGVSLTPKGDQLLKYAIDLLNLAEETGNALKDDGTAKGKLTIGSMESTAISFLPKLLSAYHQENPNVTLTVKTGTTESRIRGVLNHSLDGAFVAGPIKHPDLSTKVAKKEQLVLIAASTYSTESPADVFLRQPLLVFPLGCSYRKLLENWLSAENSLPEKIIEFNSLGAIFASVSAGLGISLFPESTVNTLAVRGELCCHAIPERFAVVPTVFVYRKKGFMESSLRKFIHSIG